MCWPLLLPPLLLLLLLSFVMVRLLPLVLLSLSMLERPVAVLVSPLRSLLSLVVLL